MQARKHVWKTAAAVLYPPSAANSGLTSGRSNSARCGSGRNRLSPGGAARPETLPATEQRPRRRAWAGTSAQDGSRWDALSRRVISRAEATSFSRKRLGTSRSTIDRPTRVPALGQTPPGIVRGLEQSACPQRDFSCRSFLSMREMWDRSESEQIASRPAANEEVKTLT